MRQAAPRCIEPGGRRGGPVDDLASRHGSATTTDFGMLTEEEICAVCEGGLEGEFETLHLFDADGRGSVEIICDKLRLCE